MIDYAKEVVSQFSVWEVVGFIGLGFFSARFIVQWIASEQRKESYIPVSFWYLSIIGSLILLSYALAIKKPVVICGYLFNSLIYVRNLILIKKKKRGQENLG